MAIWGIAVVLAGTSAQGQTGPQSRSIADTQAQLVVRQASEALARHSSVSAKLRQRIELYGHELFGSGIYLQGPSQTHWLRWELRLRLASRTVSLQQVCDGDHLWIHRQLDGRATLARVDVARVLAAGQSSPVAWRPEVPHHPVTRLHEQLPSVAPELGIGGLPKLLDGLEKSFQFTGMTESRLGELPVIVAIGRWEPGLLAQILPEEREAILAGRPVDLGKLPPALPDQVVVVLGREDRFPYRIEYRRAEPAAGGKAAGGDGHFKSLVTLELFDVQFDAPIDERLFVYEPGTMAVSDETDQYICNLGL